MILSCIYWLWVCKSTDKSARLHGYVRVRLIAHRMGSVSLCRIIKPLFKIADTSNSLALKHRQPGSLDLLGFFHRQGHSHGPMRSHHTLSPAMIDEGSHCGAQLAKTNAPMLLRPPKNLRRASTLSAVAALHWLAHWLIKFQGHRFNSASLICIGNYFPLC